MPLRPCPECNTEVSDQARACPKCGHPLKTPDKAAKIRQFSPSFAAIFNFLLPGVGYLYVRKFSVFVFLVLCAQIAALVYYSTLDLEAFESIPLLASISDLLLSVAFAVDGVVVCRQKNKELLAAAKQP